ncbi:MAG: rhodanese-like domain-containing protein [Bacteroidota bacterium]|nr:rhodanese-like domain-containing protein [Bacteroidota bacterium]
MTTIQPEELEEVIRKEKELQIIDLRPVASYEKSHIKGAISIPRDLLLMNMKKLATSGTILFYCMEGHKSDEVALYIEKKKKRCKILSLNGGYNSYNDSL